MPNVTLIAPAGATSVIHGGNGKTAQAGPDGSVILDVSNFDIGSLLRAGYRYFRVANDECVVQAPATADLVSIVAAVLPVSGTAFTIAAQPGVPRKLQVRCVQSGAVASLVVNLVGIDGRGNAITESVNVAGASSATFATANAYAKLTSATPVGTVTNVTTLGIGVGAALALPVPQVPSGLVVYKASVAATGSAAYADEAVGTVDATANTISPTSAPDGAKCFKFWFNVGLAD